MRHEQKTTFKITRITENGKITPKKAFLVGGSPLVALDRAFIRTVEETALP